MSNKTKLLLSSLLLIIIILLIGCTSREPIYNNYYILEYFERNEKENLIQDEPILSDVVINDATINKPYNRDNIVIRYFGPKIKFSREEFWGINIKEIIPDLLSKRLRRYNIFNNVERDFTRSQPKYEIFINIENIEKFTSGSVHEAHLSMEILLKRSDGTEVVSHSFNREITLASQSMDIFVQKINDLVLEAANEFSRKILVEYEDEYKPKEVEKIRTKSITQDSVGTLQKKGQLLLPLLTDTEAEVPYKISDSTGKTLDIEANMGEPVTLPAGEYKIKFGSGREDQKMTKEVQVDPYYKTVVEPDWSSLLVDVIDVNRNYRQIRYEIFNAQTGESYGTHLPAKKELGEQQKVWILEPGLYKITIKNEPFNTYRNFTTVYLQPGKVNHTSLVVELDENNNPTNLTGAGILREFTQKETDNNWQTSNALHANFNMNINKNNDSGGDIERYLQLNTQFENYVIYNKMPYYYRLRHLSELGTSKRNENDFSKNLDNIDIKNTFIYFLTDKLGVYTRLDANSHFLRGFYNREESFNYYKNGLKKSQRVQTTPYVFPLNMKEGLGFNYRLLNDPRYYLNLRAGLGLRQKFMDNVYQKKGSSSDTLRFVERQSTTNEGTELSLVGDFNLPLNITYRTNLDMLFPFEGSSSPTLEWENDLNLRLFKYLSVYYRFNVNGSSSDLDRLYYSHNIFLRLSYFFH